MKSDHVSETPNQIPPTDEIIRNLNHSGIYNTENRKKMLCVRIYILNRVVRECKITNKVNKEDNANINFKKTQLMCTVVFLKESGTSLKRSQAKFIFKWSKANWTEQNKNKVLTWCTPIYVTFDMSFATPQSNSSALLFFERLFFRNNSVKQNKVEGQN